MFGFQKLDVYRCAVTFVGVASTLAERVPRGNSALADQLRRAALSVSLNIAEGSGRTRAGCWPVSPEVFWNAPICWSAGRDCTLPTRPEREHCPDSQPGRWAYALGLPADGGRMIFCERRPECPATATATLHCLAG